MTCPAMRKLAPLALVLAALAWPAHAADPPLAPGRDPGGGAVAIVGPGVDYRNPALARVLARDGEGEAIAWDAIDNDHRPFAKDESATAFALAAARNGSVRVVPIRAGLQDPASLARAITFAVATPARIVVVPLEEKQRSALAVLVAAARRFETALFVASVPSPTPDEQKAADTAANLVLRDGGTDPHAAADAIATTIGCGQADLTGASGPELKQMFLDRLARTLPGCQPKTGDAK
jgi:hypothetical protein